MTFLFKCKSGIWYYRKTVVLPSGERKQIRQSLRTYNPKLAQYLALELYFSIGPDRDVVAIVSKQQAGELIGPNLSRYITKVTPNQFASAVLGLNYI